LQKLAFDPKYLGGAIGMIGVLQTWTRSLDYHPHIHYLIPSGALSPDGMKWISAKDTFLMHHKPLSIIFRAKVKDALKKAGLFKQVPPQVWQQDWVVHIEPVGNGHAVLKYLAPYIFTPCNGIYTTLPATCSAQRLSKGAILWFPDVQKEETVV
jgi:hypothetical protein